MITIGIVMSYLVNFSFATTDEGWRYMFAFGLIPSILLFFGMFLLPNSPQWLFSKGRLEDAKASLSLIYSSKNVEHEMNIIASTIDENSKKVSYKELLTPMIKPVLLIGIGIMFFQQVTGINTVIYYSPTILQMAGFASAKDAMLAALPIGIVNVLATILSIYLIDRLGRKPLLYIGVSGMIIALVILGGIFSIDVSSQESSLKYFAVGSLILYIFSFGISLGPIAWLLIAEVFPLRVRNIGMSISTLSNWLFNLIVALTFLSIIEHLGATGTFWLYASFGVLTLIFVWKFIPETKGKTLEEIETHFSLGKKATEL
jgi:sugar porter (SP) family MFS transporter